LQENDRRERFSLLTLSWRPDAGSWWGYFGWGTIRR
jgi:hypothetical protein